MAHPEVGSETATITLNGDLRAIPAGTTVATLLESLELDPHLVVVERNRVIVRDRDTYPHTPVADGDTIEIVHFVGGG